MNNETIQGMRIDLMGLIKMKLKRKFAILSTIKFNDLMNLAVGIESDIVNDFYNMNERT